MNKFMKILMVVGLMVAVATPAMAQFKLNGYFRTMMYSLERKSTASTDGVSQQFTDQRLRLRMQYSLNDNVAIVYFGEADNVWGDTTVNSAAGALGSDGVNLQTKHAFLNVKFDNTNIVLGTQGLKDDFLGLVFFDDMTGISATQKYGNTTLQLAYAKWDEGVRSEWDDSDFYIASLNHKFSDAFSAGAAIYYNDDNDFQATRGFRLPSNIPAGDAPDDVELFFYGVHADYRFSNFGINGFFLMQDGEGNFADPTLSSVDHQAWAASVKGNMKLANGEIGLRYLYITDDDDAVDSGAWVGEIGGYSLAGEGMMIFFFDPYYMNSGFENYAMVDSANQGFGLHALTLHGSHNLPDAMYFKWGVGYFMAAEDQRDSSLDPADNREDKDLGWEVNARIGKKFFDKVDVSANAAYADFGGFYDNTVNGVDDPDGIYKAYLMVNVPF